MTFQTPTAGPPSRLPVLGIVAGLGDGTSPERRAGIAELVTAH